MTTTTFEQAVQLVLDVARRELGEAQREVERLQKIVDCGQEFLRFAARMPFVVIEPEISVAPPRSNGQKPASAVDSTPAP